MFNYTQMEYNSNCKTLHRYCYVQVYMYIHCCAYLSIYLYICVCVCVFIFNLYVWLLPKLHLSHRLFIVLWNQAFVVHTVYKHAPEYTNIDGIRNCNMHKSIHEKHAKRTKHQNNEIRQWRERERGKGTTDLAQTHRDESWEPLQNERVWRWKREPVSKWDVVSICIGNWQNQLDETTERIQIRVKTLGL